MVNQSTQYSSWLDETLPLCADNFLGQPMGLFASMPHLHDPNVWRPWCCWSAQFLTICESPSPKLTALEVRDGSSTFLAYMGEPWNDGLVIGPAADLALLFTVLCTPLYPSSVGVQFALSAVSLLSRPQSMMSPPVWVPPRFAKFNKHTSNEATPT